jgi:hypothetical protein
MRLLSVLGVWAYTDTPIGRRRKRRHLFLSQALTSARVTRRPPSIASNSVPPSHKPIPHKQTSVKSDS